MTISSLFVCGGGHGGVCVCVCSLSEYEDHSSFKRIDGERQSKTGTETERT